ncbi:MAG: hypothetical protein H8F28_14455, partial [Fibrella sp.]|nr:hypothetical protein [Armatimonadota bacterium]
MSALGQIERWIKETLLANPAVADGANGVYHTMAVQKTPAPYVVISLSGRPVVSKTLCGAVESIRAVYDIRVVG